MSAGATSSPARQDGNVSGGAPVSANHNVELKSMSSQQAGLPVEEDIMQLARLGEIAAIQKLFDRGKFDANYKDDQGITPLHVSFDDRAREYVRL